MVTTKNTKNVLKPAFSKTGLIISSDIDDKFFGKLIIERVATFLEDEITTNSDDFFKTENVTLLR